MDNSSYVLRDSGAIEITKEGTVISKLRICNPEGFAIIIKANNVTIQECDITGSINLYGPVHGVVIRNNYIHDVSPQGNDNFNKQFAGITTTEGNRWANPLVQPMGAYDITIEGNYFENCPTGIFLVECKGPINILGNYNRNQCGPFPRGAMLQMAICDGGSGNIIVENNFSYVNTDLPQQKGFLKNGKYGCEDHINFYDTSGSEIYPIIIRNNFLTGNSASVSGSGIMLGDKGGSYYHVVDNKVYNTGNAGIGICGGHHWFVKGNWIYQNPASTQYDGRGLQIEKYGDEFESPVIVEENKAYWACGKGNGSLFCATDVVTFRDNCFGKSEVFKHFDPILSHEPSGAVEGLIRPWEISG